MGPMTIEFPDMPREHLDRICDLIGIKGVYEDEMCKFYVPSDKIQAFLDCLKSKDNTK
jgi:hypothetical protein